MPQPFRASAARMSAYLDSIQNGKPIDNDGQPWSHLDLLALAGCAQCAALSHGPMGIERSALSALHPEKAEAVGETFQQEVMLTVGFLATVAFDVIDGNFESKFGDDQMIQGVLMLDERGQPIIQLYRP